MSRWRRSGLRVCLLLVAVSAMIGSELKSTNIIIISVDTLRADHLGCYGYSRNISPAIDRLAEDGIRFAWCFTMTPLTAPAFSTMLTSLSPHKHGAKKNGLSIFKHVRTLPWYLRNYGYVSAAFISNWPLRKRLSMLHRDFDTYEEIFTKKRRFGLLHNEGTAETVTRRAVQWLNGHRGEKFFLWVQYTDPHAPYIFHSDFAPKNEKMDARHYPAGTQLSRIKKYDTEIAYTDLHIGQLIEELKTQGLYRDALIIFNSDHGESFGEHDYFKHGRKLYNSCLHVPLIIKLPRIRQKITVSDRYATLLDVAPTILSVLKYPLPEHMEGASVLGKMSRERLFFETYGGAAHLNRSNRYRLKVSPIRYGVLSGPMKVIYSSKSRKWEMYDILKDRFEHRNLRPQLDREFRPLKVVLMKYVREVRRNIELAKKGYEQRSELSKEDVEKLRSLGYLK
jgi:arylsulfatase A-like enzyme